MLVIQPLYVPFTHGQVSLYSAETTASSKNDKKRHLVVTIRLVTVYICSMLECIFYLECTRFCFTLVFQESAIMNNTRRNVTVISKTHIELLVVSKEVSFLTCS